MGPLKGVPKTVLRGQCADPGRSGASLRSLPGSASPSPSLLVSVSFRGPARTRAAVQALAVGRAVERGGKGEGGGAAGSSGIEQDQARPGEIKRDKARSREFKRDQARIKGRGERGGGARCTRAGRAGRAGPSSPVHVGGGGARRLARAVENAHLRGREETCSGRERERERERKKGATGEGEGVRYRGREGKRGREGGEAERASERANELASERV